MNKLTLAPLPYDYTALEPVISKQIMELHHDKHYLAYVNGANSAIDKLKEYETKGTELAIRETLRDLSFNLNGARLHELFFAEMQKAAENNQPKGKVKEQLEKSFGSWESFKKEFSAAGVSVEGSGWAVLGQSGDELAIYQLEKHNLLGFGGFKPVLVLDVWEHAYYLDYLNNRAAYVEKWWSVVNWEEVAKTWAK